MNAITLPYWGLNDPQYQRRGRQYDEILALARMLGETVEMTEARCKWFWRLMAQIDTERGTDE